MAVASLKAMTHNSLPGKTLFFLHKTHKMVHTFISQPSCKISRIGEKNATINENGGRITDDNACCHQLKGCLAAKWMKN